MALDGIRAVATLWGRAQDMVIGLDRVFETLDRVPEVCDAPRRDPAAAVLAHRRAARRLLRLRRRAAGGARRGPGRTAPARCSPSSARPAPARARSSASSPASSIPTPAPCSSTATTCDGRPSARSATRRRSRSRSTCSSRPACARTCSTAARTRATRTCARRRRWRAPTSSSPTCPHGYDTLLGERGAKLSTGQRQRIGIARALLKGAPILLLDEPTAALDPDTELRLLDNLRAWSAGRCVILVTHRLSAVRRADRVVFLEQGRVVEEGRHDELLARAAGRYRAFVDAQYAPLLATRAPTLLRRGRFGRRPRRDAAGAPAGGERDVLRARERST